jgi:release factor glutamine methyltransferase
VPVPTDLPPPQAVTLRLRTAGCVAAEEEADELLAATPDAVTLAQWVIRRERGEPLAWIIGSLQFCGRRVLVDPGVYVPRIQSEALARRAAALLPADGGRAADLCTGAGAVASHLVAAVPTAGVIGTDIDPASVRCARRNGVSGLLADLDEPLRGELFDIVTAVPPYVPTAELRYLPADVQTYEPPLALDGGPDGLHLARRVVASASRLLRAGGWLLVELGGDQDRELAPTLDACGFEPAQPWFDEDDDLRGLAARRSNL